MGLEPTGKGLRMDDKEAAAAAQHRRPVATAAPSSAALRLNLLGRPAWQLAQTSGPLSRKDAALLAMLVLDGPQPRERLAGRLWPDVPADRALANLRQRLFRLRRDIGCELLASAEPLALVSPLHTDVDPGDPTQLTATEDGLLLGAFDYADTEWLQQWVSDARQRCLAQRADALQAALQHHEQQGDLATAVALGERLVRAAPLREDAWRRLMRLYHQRGDRAAAIATFERLEQTLRDEQGSRPSADSLAELQRIEHDRSPAGSPNMLAPCSLPPSLVRPPLLVGRQDELRAMDRAWTSGRAFLLLGAAGMGKSRLLADFLAGRSGVVLECGRPGDERTPYATLTRLLRQTLHRHLPSRPTDPELARLLPELGQAPRATGQQLPLWHAVEGMLSSAHHHGLQALVLDDMQFADPASAELLRWLMPSQALSGLRFALASRPLDEAGQSTDHAPALWLADSGRPEPIVLRPLAQTEVAQLLHSLGLGWVDAPTLAPALFRHAGGQPFYTLETLKDLALDPASASDGLPRPATVSALIERRLSRLSPAAQELMRLAAVAGSDLTAEQASAILQRSPLALADPWAELETANVLQGERFAHDLVREVALASVPTAVRRALHAAVARCLVDAPGVPAGRVAEHWLAAQRWHEAGACLLAAGQAARLAGRLQEQDALLLRAAECFERTQDTHRQFEALIARLDGLVVRLGNEAMLAELPRLETLADNEVQQARVAMHRVEGLLNQAHFVAALPEAERAERLARSATLWHADALCILGQAQAANGQQTAALHTLEQARHAATVQAEQGGDTSVLLRCHIALGFVLFSAQRMTETLQVQTAAAELAKHQGDWTEYALIKNNIATTLGALGDTPAAFEAGLQARQAMRHMAPAGSASGVNLITLGQTAAALGRFDLALDVLTQAVQQLDPSSAGAVVAANARRALTELWVLLGQPAQAMAHSDDSRQPPGLSDPWAALWHYQRARVNLVAGVDPGPALELAQACVDRLTLPLHTVTPLFGAWVGHAPLAQALPALHTAVDWAQSQQRWGVARSFRLLHIARLTSHDATAAARLAHSAWQDMAQAHHPLTYPPQAWAILARAFRAVGEESSAQACRRAGWQWLLDHHAQLPTAYQTGWLSSLPLYRELGG